MVTQPPPSSGHPQPPPTASPPSGVAPGTSRSGPATPGQPARPATPQTPVHTPPRAQPAAPEPQSKAPATKGKSARLTIPPIVEMEISCGLNLRAARILIHGTSGIGKTTLASWLPGPLFFDVNKGTNAVELNRDEKIDSFMKLRGKLAWVAAGRAPPWVRTVVIDRINDAQELAVDHVVENYTNNKGDFVNSIESFGYGGGWKHVYGEMNALIADFDRLYEMSINVCCIANTVRTPVSNTMGEDYQRWEPDLYNGDKAGNSSVRDRFIGWADFDLFIAYDVNVKSHKATGSGSRAIYSQETPMYVAKGRTPDGRVIADAFLINDPGKTWRSLGIS